MKILFAECLIWIVVYSCEVKGDCNDELGMQSKEIPDSSISSSSILSAKHVPGFARLDEPQGAWCSAPNDNSPYVQILLGEEKLITKMMGQGSYKDLRWAAKYQIKYLKEGEWITYQRADGRLTLDGNTNGRLLKEHILQPPIRTHSIRIYPMVPVSVTPMKTLDKVLCLRLELYGCSASDEYGSGSGGSGSSGSSGESEQRDNDDED